MARHRILVVDDEATIGQAVRRVLFGYDVVAVTSAQAALDAIGRGEAFDAVVCDVHMPGMDGRELAFRLAAVAPSLADRVLFLSADKAAVAELADRAAMAKPVDLHALRARIEQLLPRSGLRSRFVVRAGERAGDQGPPRDPEEPQRASELPTMPPPKTAKDTGRS